MKKIMFLIAIVAGALFAADADAQAASQDTTVTYDGNTVTVKKSDLSWWNDLSIASDMYEAVDGLYADVKALKAGGGSGDGSRTMKALGKAVSKRYAGKMEANIFAKYLKANDGDSAAVRVDPDYIAAMDRLKGSKIEEAKAEAFAADLMALLDKGPGAGGGSGQTIDRDQLIKDVADMVVKILEPTMNDVVAAKVKDGLKAVHDRMDRGFATTASLITGRGEEGKKLKKEETEKAIWALTTGNY